MDLEKEYVHDVYNQIAKQFDYSRIFNWKEITAFINKCNPNSLIGDIGCGNGRNMLLRKDCTFIGCDISEQLIKICNKKKLAVIQSDNLKLSFRDNIFDYIISIAVIHHISTNVRRKQAISEMIRILKPNGLIYIQVWNKIKNYNTKEVLLPWDKTNLLRYYYIFDLHELLELVIECNAHIVQYGEDHNNWFVIANKL